MAKECVHPIVTLLDKLPEKNALLVVVVLALGALQGCKKRALGVTRAEDIVFNLDVYDWCTTQLKNRDLRWVLEYGMELYAVKDVGGWDNVDAACRRMEERLLRILILS